MEDSPNDVYYFLLTEQDASTTNITYKTDLKIIRALLRLSIKYDVEHIRKSIVTVLEKIFPSSLEKWDAAVGIREWLDETYSGLWNLEIPWEILLSNDARAHGILSVLPAALLVCLQYTTVMLLEGPAWPFSGPKLCSENMLPTVKSCSNISLASRSLGSSMLSDLAQRLCCVNAFG